eukprot:6200610-Pleurochrysis_carterae.AAC.2
MQLDRPQQETIVCSIGCITARRSDGVLPRCLALTATHGAGSGAAGEICRASRASDASCISCMM